MTVRREGFDAAAGRRSERGVRTVATVVICALAACSMASARVMSAQACASPSSRPALQALNMALEYSTSDTLEVAEWRTRYGLPKLQPSDVALVTDAAVCEQAVRAYDREYLAERHARDPNWQPTAPAQRPAHVARMGTRYLVIDPDPSFRSGEFRVFYIFDSTFATKITSGFH